MAKALWIAAYRSISNPERLGEYAKLSLPAIVAGGGRLLARGLPAATKEHGLSQRTVVFEFDSVGQALAAYDSPAYGKLSRSWVRIPSNATSASWKWWSKARA